MTRPIPTEIDTNLNQEVLASLKGASCHSDIIIPLQQSLSDCLGVQSYCPDEKNYSYVCWYVNGVVFAYATGMQKVSIRLAQKGALDTGKLKSPDNFFKCNSWYSVPYNSDDLGILAKSAYESAISS
jgi:hypothetical protein